MEINFSYLLSQIKSKKLKKAETISKLHCEITSFDPTHLGFFMKSQPLQADLVNLSCDNFKQNALFNY